MARTPTRSLATAAVLGLALAAVPFPHDSGTVTIEWRTGGARAYVGPDFGTGAAGGGSGRRD